MRHSWKMALLFLSSPAFAGNWTGPFKEGQTYAIDANITGDQRFLEAKTAEGNLALTKDIKLGAAQWRVQAYGNAVYSFEALSTTSGPRWLALNAAGAITLAKSDNALTSRWKATGVGDGRFYLENLGSKAENRLLNMQDNGIALAKAGGEVPSSAHFRFVPYAPISYPVTHGDVISLKSLATIEGPHFLEGSTYDGRILLQWSDEPVQYSGALWRVHNNQDGTYSLECLGDYAGARWLALKDGQLQLASTTDRGVAHRWRLDWDGTGAITIRNAESRGDKPWLNGVSSKGLVGFSSHTGAGASGTHWQVIKHKTANPQVEGRWSTVEDLPHVPIHAAVLPSKKVLFWSRFAQEGIGDGVTPGQSKSYLFDPLTATSQTIKDAPVDAFCSGMAFLPDGRLLVNGGHIKDNVGTKSTQIFNSKDNSWAYSPDWNMNQGRWYPTTVTMHNGDIFTISGSYDAGKVNRTPQVWSHANNSWRNLGDLASCEGPCTILYPWIHPAPNGQIFASGATDLTGYLNADGNGKWTNGPKTTKGFRGAYQGTSVQYAPGEILIAGGLPATSSAEVINLNQANATWAAIKNMRFARKEPTGTILADGSVLISGGNLNSDVHDATAAFVPEIFSPQNKSFTQVDHLRVPRLYHATTVLLPDGRVMSMGGGLGGGFQTHKNYQIYSPPYLFKGDRPVIDEAPESVKYNASFTLKSQHAGRVQKINLVRLSADTHAFNASQAFVSLSFEQADQVLTVKTPASGKVVPPGPYMIFIVDKDGIPSEAAMTILN